MGAFIVSLAATAAPASAKIYFFSSPSAPVDDSSNRLVRQPSTLPLFQDGQWILEKLHWTGWGSSVARAKGLSSSSNGDPNASEGDRIVTKAKVRLSMPGHYRGHPVYRCFQVSVPPPAHYGRRCLQRVGHSVGLFLPGSGEPVGESDKGQGARHLAQFFSPDRDVWCSFLGSIAEITCGTRPEPPMRSASIDNRGHVSICEVLQTEYAPGSHIPLGCYQNWPRPTDHLPVLHNGETSATGRFLCTSATNAITCTKTSGAGTGNGFRVSRDESIEVSPETGP